MDRHKQPTVMLKLDLSPCAVLRDELNRLGGRFKVAFPNWWVTTQKWVIGSRLTLTVYIIFGSYDDYDWMKAFCIVALFLQNKFGLRLHERKKKVVPETTSLEALVQKTTVNIL